MLRIIEKIIEKNGKLLVNLPVAKVITSVSKYCVLFRQQYLLCPSFILVNYVIETVLKMSLIFLMNVFVIKMKEIVKSNNIFCNPNVIEILYTL